MFSIEIKINNDLKVYVYGRNIEQKDNTANYSGYFKIVDDNVVVSTSKYYHKGHNRDDGIVRLCADVLSQIAKEAK